MKTLDQVEARTIINATNTPGNSINQFIITAPGSYYLTDNINGVSGKNGILINSINVTVDLNGFALIGVSGSQAGIWDGGNNRGNATVRNGTIGWWGGPGLDLGSSYDSIIADLIVTNNDGGGMFLSDACVVRDCMTRDNTGDNISAGYNTNVLHCTSVHSFIGYGFHVGPASTLTNCTSNFNTLYGIATGTDSLVSHCVAANNAGGGIEAGDGSTIANSAASRNGGGGGSVYGIYAGAGCAITDCTASFNNATYGIYTGVGSSLSHCSAAFNQSSASISAGIATLDGCTLTNCSARSNKTSATPTSQTGIGFLPGFGSTIQNCTAVANKGDGIRLNGNSLVLGCTADSNEVDGIHSVASNNRIDGNHAISNGGTGIHSLTATADWIVRNVSYGSVSGINYNPASGTFFGPLSTPGGATSPWANF